MRKNYRGISKLLAVSLLIVALGCSISTVEKEDLEIKNGTISEIEFAGKKGFALKAEGLHVLACMKDMNFENGTIEVDLGSPDEPGQLGPGIAFRIQDEVVDSLKINNPKQKYEYFYFRPYKSQTNNAIQYAAGGTKYYWKYLRENHPGVYEGEAELPITGWFHVRVEVAGSVAKVYVNNAEEPNLIVNDLKHGLSRGSVGIYSYHKTIYFANLKVVPN